MKDKVMRDGRVRSDLSAVSLIVLQDFQTETEKERADDLCLGDTT